MSGRSNYFGYSPKKELCTFRVGILAGKLIVTHNRRYYTTPVLSTTLGKMVIDGHWRTSSVAILEFEEIA